MRHQNKESLVLSLIIVGVAIVAFCSFKSMFGGTADTSFKADIKIAATQ